ncbi:transmembrane protein 215-like [Megalops cyprinoides]|uniref:transmembrane protein 215-like n=1 Tax=Megalops cyprinoides TaxID=118141 RepID=UPI001864B5CC|nr:transmembrane protein 215-like [Megalops cyprinoides]
MRPDHINPRTGIVVALCCIFLVFGFMFTVSGTKGETLGDIPLIALGPAICLPGVVALILAKKTKGFTKCPCKCRCARRQRKPRTRRRAQEPWDTVVCEELEEARWDRRARSGEDSVSTTTTVGESSHLIRSIEQDEVLRYLRACYPASTFMATRDVSNYCVFDRLCSPRDSVAYTAARSSVVYMPRDSIVVYSRRDSTPYSTYCCYINPRDFSWGNETVV